MKKMLTVLLFLTFFACMTVVTYAVECPESPSGDHNTWVYVDKTYVVDEQACYSHNNCVKVKICDEFGTKCKWCRTILNYSKDYSWQHVSASKLHTLEYNAFTVPK